MASAPITPVRRLGLLLAATLALLAAAPAIRAEPLAGERLAQVKAAFILNIARFTRWPEGAFASADAPLELCLLNENPLGGALESIRGKGVGKRKLTIKAVSADEPGCHVLFIPQSNMDRLARQTGTPARANLLTIGDHTDAAGSEPARIGEVVALIREENRIAFEVDLDAARNAGIELSSELLKLGRIVRRDR